MRVAALYDVHGNMPALLAVLQDVAYSQIDQIVFGGDLAAGPFPRDTVEHAGNIANARFVQGNADRMMVEIFDGRAEPQDGLIDEWAVAQLGREHRDFLGGFEPRIRLAGALFCHATPHDDMPIFTRITPDERVRDLLGDIDDKLIVCGHTHMQFDRTVDDVRVVNAGSVGMPYGTFDACWAIVEDGEAELRRTPYDREQLRLSEYPMLEQFLEGASEEEAIEFFESQAGA